jgi:hypothetical protein
MAVTEERPVPQHMGALAKADRIRRARAALKRDVAQGATTVAEVVLDPPDYAETMTLMQLLKAQHRWQDVRARRFLQLVCIGEAKTLGRLTQRQRLFVAAVLRGDVDPSWVDPRTA